MLAFNMKGTERREIQKTLLSIAEHAHANKVHDLHNAREQVRKLTFAKNGAAQAKVQLAHYYKLATHMQHLLENKTPLAHASPKLAFVCRDNFDPNLALAYSDWRWERAAVLFNLAAALSYIATTQDRKASHGIRQACVYYQQAAGTVAELRSLIATAPWPRRTPDLSSEFLDALQTIMLAQAQKCFYEKAVMDGKSHAIIAKLAAECFALYEATSLNPSAADSTTTVPAEWFEVMEWNRLLFDGMQQYYLATAHGEKREWGKQLSRLTHAANQTGLAVKASRKAPADLQGYFRSAHTRCLDAYQKAKHDNDLIYTEKVPPLHSLPSPERAAMVKPIRLAELDEESSREQDAASTVAVGLTTMELGAVTAPPPSFAEASSAALESLTESGFERDKALAALAQNGGSLELARDVLESQK